MGSFRPDANLLKKHPNAITQTQIDEKGRFIGAPGLGAVCGFGTARLPCVMLTEPPA